MSKLAGLGAGPLLGGAGVVLIGAIGILYGTGIIGPRSTIDPVQLAAVPAEDQSRDQTPESVQVNAPEKDAAAEQDTASDTDTSLPVKPLPSPPSIDTFRLDPDGSMLVAGQAHPDWTTMIMLDGDVLGQADPDDQGKFVAFMTLETSDEPRVLSLEMKLEGSEHVIVSNDEIIIAPLSQPVAGLTVANDAAGTSESAATQPSDETTSKPIPSEEAGAQAVLLANESGVEILQPAQPINQAPEVMSSVALDAISYSELGEVELTGRGQQDGFVRVYLDNAPVTSSRIAQDGKWRTELPDVDTGVYTLRIDEIDASGEVTSRVETPFKRESEDLVAQNLPAKAKVTAITVQPGSTLWAISRERYGDGVLYVRVYEANKDRIRNPDLIYPGQVFALPD